MSIPGDLKEQNLILKGKQDIRQYGMCLKRDLSHQNLKTNTMNKKVHHLNLTDWYMTSQNVGCLVSLDPHLFY